MKDKFQTGDRVKISDDYYDVRIRGIVGNIVHRAAGDVYLFVALETRQHYWIDASEMEKL